MDLSPVVLSQVIVHVVSKLISGVSDGALKTLGSNLVNFLQERLDRNNTNLAKLSQNPTEFQNVLLEMLISEESFRDGIEKIILAYPKHQTLFKAVEPAEQTTGTVNQQNNSGFTIGVNQNTGSQFFRP